MPGDAPLEAQAFWWMSETGCGFQDIFGMPFVDLPPELAGRLTHLAQRNLAPWKKTLQEIRDLLQALGLGKSG